MFPTKFPILLAGMNPVSDVNLAVACYQAGMMPTLCGFIYYRNGNLNNALFDIGLTEYVQRTGASNVIPSLGGQDIENEDTLKILVKHTIQYVELIEGVDEESWPNIKKLCTDNNILPIIKILHYKEILNGFNTVMLKGPTGAGRGNFDNLSLDDVFDTIKSKHPNINIIVSGGIGTGADIEKYLNKGAVAVAIGTLFAATKESCVSDATKQKMVESKSSDITRLGDAKQNAIVFSVLPEDDYNNTKSIRLGIRSPNQGHIFSGNAIDQVNSISTVNTVLTNLLKDTRYEKNYTTTDSFSFPTA
jgi:hypothetical protein